MTIFTLIQTGQKKRFLPFSIHSMIFASRRRRKLKECAKNKVIHRFVDFCRAVPTLPLVVEQFIETTELLHEQGPKTT
jgi:hypothetical protein